MSRWIQKLSYVALLFTLLLGVALHTTIYAASTCSASVSPNNVEPASSTNFIINITNTGSSDIKWIDLTVPSSNFTYAGNSISGWDTADHAGGTTITGNSIAPSQTASFSMTANTDLENASAANWHIQTSDDPGGSGPTTCGGNISTSITGHPPNDSVNGVSNVLVTALSASSATITWDSDNPTTSLVYYGKTSNYGSTSSYNQTLDTSHSVTLTGLSAATGYHYQVAGSDGQGGFAYSADNTFLTATAPVANTPSPAAHSVIVGKGVTTDKVPPQIILSTKVAGAYKSAPSFSGSASDDKAVTKVEYSTDGGKNWLPVDKLTASGKLSVNFTFTPLLPQDGNYQIMARATDVGSNTTTTDAQTLVIDRLPPLAGGNVVSVGPQVIQPGQDGTMRAIIGIDQKITLSAVGGPTTISLSATTTIHDKKGTKTFAQNFSLTQSEDTGLWSGVTSFARPGDYVLTVHAIDGAGNTTSRVLNTVVVSSPGHTINKKSAKAIASTVLVYYLEPESHTWVVWDAAGFGQHNPQRTGRSGTFSLFLPAGKYYLKATAPGYRTFVSSIIDAKQPTPISTDLSLQPMHGLHLGSHYLILPSLAVQPLRLVSDKAQTSNQNNLVGKELPDFTLTDTTGTSVTPVTLLGRPTVISFDSTWAPTTAEQLTALSKLQANPEFNVIPVALQESSGRVQAYTAIADVKLRWLVDQDGALSASYNVQSMPLHYFVDRKGVIRQVVVGVLNTKQMQDRLMAL